MRSLPTRRELLALLLRATAPGMLPSPAPRAEPRSRKAQVLVIGAGMAGLAAAQSLHAQGTQVLVLEAREQPGGRVRTLQDSSGMPVDVGASWIHGVKGNPLTELARRYELPTRPTDYESHVRYHADGKRFTEREAERLEALYRSVLARAERSAEPSSSGAQAQSLGAALDAVLGSRKLKARERSELEHVLNSELEHEYAADVHELSLLHWAEGREHGGGDVLFPRGFGELPARLAEPLDIRYGQHVTRIEHGESGVKATTQEGTFEAERAVVTLPLGVLKRGAVSFSPELPEPKQEAIRRLGMGLLNKTFLRFPSVFWDEGVELIGYAGRRKGQWAEWLNVACYTRQPVLLGFNAGSYARSLEPLEDEALVREALQVLRTVYGRKVPEPTGVVQTRWLADPYAGGSYSFMAAGATPEHRKALSATVGERLFFAGEATSLEAPATVHGAWLSGLREARRILKLETP